MCTFYTGFKAGQRSENQSSSVVEAVVYFPSSLEHIDVIPYLDTGSHVTFVWPIEDD